MEDNHKKRVASINNEQKDLLINYIKENPELNKGLFSQEFTKKQAQKMWTNIATILNAVAGGANKDWRQWRKSWQDLKKNAKSKAAKEKKHARGTGGGEPLNEPASQTDQDILELISPVVTDGHNSTKEIQETTTEDDILTLQDGMEVAVPMHQLIDHDYGESPQTKANEVKRSNNTPKKKRLTKSTRLSNSIAMSTNLIKVEQEKKELVKNYYREKLEILKRNEERNERKILALEKAVDIKHGILKELQNIKVQLSEKW